ncbi:MAG: hypothetical protein K9I94_07055 [Bacteroidales bacterium]|nr:hypothetical protein [Bacteroidales bacterium]
MEGEINLKIFKKFDLTKAAVAAKVINKGLVLLTNSGLLEVTPCISPKIGYICTRYPIYQQI